MSEINNYYANVQVLPPPSDMKRFMSSQTSVRDDYTFFGPHINRTAYDDSQKSLDWVKAVNTCDSVGRTMRGKGRMYWKRVQLDHWGNRQALRPPVWHEHWHPQHPVRADCIWKWWAFME